jgi:hypothetical protein
MGAIVGKLTTTIKTKDPKKKPLLNKELLTPICCEGLPVIDDVKSCGNTFEKSDDGIVRIKCFDGDYKIAIHSYEKLPEKVHNINFYELEITKFYIKELIEFILTDTYQSVTITSTLVKCGLTDFIKKVSNNIMIPQQDKAELYDWKVSNGLNINIMMENGYKLGGLITDGDYWVKKLKKVTDYDLSESNPDEKHM